MDIVSIARRERIIAIANVTPIIDVTGYSVDALRNIGAKSHRVATPISFESNTSSRIFDCETSVENSVG